MSDKIDGSYSLTAPAVMAHPNLFVARAFGAKGKENGTPKFSANFVFEGDAADLKAMKELAVKIAKARWPGRDIKELKFPFSNGTKLAEKRKAKGKEDGEFQRDKVVMAARSKYQPNMAILQNGKITDLETEAARAANKNAFYFGVEALAQFNFQPYDGVGNNPDGVTAYLNMVLSLNKGARLSGGASASQVFAGYKGSVSAEDPTAGADETLGEDDIPMG